MTNERYQLSADDKGAISNIEDALADQLDDLAWSSGEFDHLDDEEQMDAAEPRAEALALELLKQRLGWHRWVERGRPHESAWDSMRAAIDEIEREVN